LRAKLVAEKITQPAELDRIEAAVVQRVNDAVAYAEAGEPADPELAETLMFAPERQN